MFIADNLNTETEGRARKKFPRYFDDYSGSVVKDDPGYHCGCPCTCEFETPVGQMSNNLEYISEYASLKIKTGVKIRSQTNKAI